MASPMTANAAPMPAPVGATRLCHVGSAAALAGDAGGRGLDECAGAKATRHEVVADGHEELRLLGVEGQGDDPRAKHAAHIARIGLELVHRPGIERIRDQPDAAHGRRAARQVRWSWHPAGRRRPQPLLEVPDAGRQLRHAVGQSVGAVDAGRLSGALEQGDT